MKYLILILSLFSLNANATTYYVKVAGGTGAGTSDATAWSYAKFNSTSTSSGDSILFNRGESFYGAFTPRAGAKYGTYGSGAQPIISGFTSLTSWTSVGTNLWEASLSAGSKETMVTVNGVVVEPGRFPNTGWLTIGTGGASSLTTATSSPSTYNGGNVVIKKREWAIEKHPITSVSGTTINYDNQGSGFPSLDGWGFYFTDHPGTLDIQNEWSYTSGTIRMYSTVNPSTLNVKAATVTSLITISSLSNISFSDITFEGTVGAIFTISGSTSNNSMKNCTIRFAGTHAMSANGMTDFLMDHCNVNQTNYSAINAIGGARHRFLDNEIYYAGMRTSLCGPDNAANHGLLIAGTADTARGNVISYTGYNGIYFAGNNQQIVNNYIHHFMQTCADGGGIYNGSEPGGVGRLIDHNIVTYGLGPRDGTPFSGYDNAMGMYVDESSAGITVTNNFFGFNNGSGMYVHIGFNLTIKNNTFYGNTHRQFYAAEDGPTGTKIRNIIFTGNTLHSLSSSDYIYFFYAVGSIDTFFTRIDQNIISRPSASSNLIGISIDYTTPVTYSLSGWKAAHPALEPLSTGTPSDFATGTPVVYVNGTSSTSGVPLSGVFKALNKGTNYNIGDMVLPPWGAEVLIKTGELIPVNTVPFTARRIRF